MSKYQVDGIDLVQKMCGEFNFHRFADNRYHFSGLKEFHYSRHNDDHQYDIEMVLESRPSPYVLTMQIRFKNIQSLKIGCFGGNYIQLNDLSIKNISEDGWGKQYWEVKDKDSSELFFRCEAIEIVSVNRTDFVASLIPPEIKH